MCCRRSTIAITKGSRHVSRSDFEVLMGKSLQRLTTETRNLDDFLTALSQFETAPAQTRLVRMKYACVVFLGCSASLFAQSVDYKPAPSSPLSIPGGGHSFVAGDLDKDGHIDLVVAENNKLSVMLGDGKGGFAPSPSKPDFVTNNVESNDISILLAQ